MPSAGASIAIALNPSTVRSPIIKRAAWLEIRAIGEAEDVPPRIEQRRESAAGQVEGLQRKTHPFGAQLPMDGANVGYPQHEARVLADRGLARRLVVAGVRGERDRRSG